MSLFNLNEPNNYNARFNSLKSHSYEVWDDATQQFVPLTGGGGGGTPGELPYYLKENEIRIENSSTGSFSIMDPANFAIDGGTAGVGITKDMLMFADSTGSSTLNKPKLDLLTQLTQPKLDVLTQIKTDIVDAAETSGTQSTFIGYNPTTKKFLKNTSLSVVNPTATIERSLINYGGLYCYLTGSRYASMSATQIQAINGSNYINLLASATPTSNALTISANSVTRSLNIDDIVVTNNLKALANKTVDANSKMMIYDNTTKAFNYTTIPAGGASYAYNTAAGINISVNDFANGVKIGGVDGIQTTFNGDELTMTNMLEFDEATIDFTKFKRLSKISDFKVEAKLIDFSKCKTLKYDVANTPIVGGGTGLNSITGFKAGDKYFFKSVNDYTFDPTLWYTLPFVNVHTTPNTRWKITLHRDVSNAGAPDLKTLFHTYDYSKDTAQVRYTNTGTTGIPVNTLFFQIKIGSGNPQWRSTDMFCIELVEIAPFVAL